MASVQACTLPDGALLGACRAEGGYTDCFAVDVAYPVSHEQFVYAFYTSLPFKLERGILRWAVSKPSTDAQARQLAAGAIDAFSAWRVEGRAADQLLMADFRSRTKSWLMVSPIVDGTGTATRLYFGSAVMPVVDPGTNRRSLGPVFRALLGFHRLYSVILLRAARSRLIALRAAG